MRCPSCGAHNAAAATWCSQCFARFGAGSADAEATGPAGRRPHAEPASRGRDVRDHAGTVEWRCGACDGWNALALATCGTCGSPRTGFGVDDRPAPRPARPPDRVLAAAAVVPGLGHVLVGRTGSGLARLVLAVLWLAGGVSIAFGTGTAVGRVPGIVLLLGAAALWVGSAVDARELAAGGRRELLGNRALLWLVVAVTGLVTLGLLLVAAAR